jgi:hypothetical protein
MTRFGGGQGYAYGLYIAHFPDEYDVGGLPERGFYGLQVRLRIRRYLPLAHYALFVPVYKFYGVFERYYVPFFICVYRVDHAGERGRFAASGGPRDQNQPFCFRMKFNEIGRAHV